jgi:hypothetical protein
LKTVFDKSLDSRQLPKKLENAFLFLKAYGPLEEGVGDCWQKTPLFRQIFLTV